MGHLFAKPLLKIPFCRFKRHTCPPPRFRLALPPPDLASAGFAVGEERTCPAGIQPFRNQKQGYIFRLIYWFSYFYCENPSRKKPIEEQWQLSKAFRNDAHARHNDQSFYLIYWSYCFIFLFSPSLLRRVLLPSILPSPPCFSFRFGNSDPASKTGKNASLSAFLCTRYIKIIYK